jgi:hypothetical protein
MRKTGHVASTGEKWTLSGFQWEIQNEICNKEELDVGGRILIKWISDK